MRWRYVVRQQVERGTGRSVVRNERCVAIRRGQEDMRLGQVQCQAGRASAWSVFGREEQGINRVGFLLGLGCVTAV